MTGFFHRIRWANVARAAALLLAVLLVLAWPRLKGHDDGLPPALAEPVTVAGEGPEAADGAAADGGAAADDGADGAVDEDPARGAGAAAAPRADGAARRKAQQRRAAKEGAARRARQRRRTVARRRRATATTAPPAAAAGATGAGGVMPSRSAYRPAPPASPAAEFRP